MKTPEAITKAAKRYLGYLDAEIREAQFSRDRIQEDIERSMNTINEYDGIIKEYRADQEEIRAWLTELEGEGQE